MAKKTALVLLSVGTEEIEFACTVDILRRGGVDVTVGGLQGSDPHECSREVKILPDLSLEDALKKGKYDAVILPGGLKGSAEFCKSAVVGKLLKEQEESGGLIAAICAAPSALKVHKICGGKKLTSYPMIERSMMEGGLHICLQDNVVVDGNLITSRGPATAIEFALAITEYLVGRDIVNSIKQQMLL